MGLKRRVVTPYFYILLCKISSSYLITNLLSIYKYLIANIAVYQAAPINREFRFAMAGKLLVYLLLQKHPEWVTSSVGLERYPDTVEVAGSNPAAPTIPPPLISYFCQGNFKLEDPDRNITYTLIDEFRFFE